MLGVVEADQDATAIDEGGHARRPRPDRLADRHQRVACGEVAGTLSVAVATTGLPRASSQLSS